MARVVTDGRTGRTRGFGFASFASEKDGDALVRHQRKVPPPPSPLPLSRTDWTRLVPPPVLIGHVSSQGGQGGRPARAQRPPRHRPARKVPPSEPSPPRSPLPAPRCLSGASGAVLPRQVEQAAPHGGEDAGCDAGPRQAPERASRSQLPDVLVWVQAVPPRPTRLVSDSAPLLWF